MAIGYAFTTTVDEVRQKALDLIDEAIQSCRRRSHPMSSSGATRIEQPAGPALVTASKGADLLVVGSRGMGGFEELLVGSVGHYCMRRAPCSVVIVR